MNGFSINTSRKKISKLAVKNCERFESNKTESTFV